ncbi:hypothetical protein BJX62DRAFT_164876 [Aspergillus germanicus]
MRTSGYSGNMIETSNTDTIVRVPVAVRGSRRFFTWRFCSAPAKSSSSFLSTIFFSSPHCARLPHPPPALLLRPYLRLRGHLRPSRPPRSRLLLQLLALALHLASEKPLQRDGLKTSSFGRWRPELTLPLALFESVSRFRLLGACWVVFASNRIVCIAASSTF